MRAPVSREVAAKAISDAQQVPRQVAVADLAALDFDSVNRAREVRQPVLWLSVAEVDRARLNEVSRLKSASPT